MRRATAIAGLLIVAALAAVLAAAGDGDGRARVAAEFDNAQFLVPGEDVKLGGVVVGDIESVSLSDDMRARVVLRIDPAFAPFRADARCSIEPQSLIGERFVQCSPGTPAAGTLAERDGLPTVPVERTSAPVDIDLVLATFRGSRGDRLRLLLNELGAGLAGRADDLNGVIRRANPALRQTRDVLEVINGQRARIAPLIEDAERTIAQLDAGRRDVRGFVSSARRTTEVVASRQADLRRGLQGLPPLLAAWRPALTRFAQATQDLDPVLADVEAAAPALTRAARGIPPLAREAGPALDDVARAARAGVPAIRDSRPVVRRLRTFAARARPVSAMLRELSVSLRDRGALDGALEFLFNATGVVARFDAAGHIAVAEAIVNDCAVYVSVPSANPDCDGHFGDDDGRVRAKARTRMRGRRRAPRRPPSASRPTPATPAPDRAPGEEGAPPLLPDLGLPSLPPITLPGLPPITLPKGDGQRRPHAEALLDYLLGGDGR